MDLRQEQENQTEPLVPAADRELKTASSEPKVLSAAVRPLTFIRLLLVYYYYEMFLLLNICSHV